MSTASVRERLPVWALALAVVLVVGAALGGLALFGAGTLPERAGPPAEQLTVERTVLSPGTIELHVRNPGPDPVQLAQVVVNDSFVDFTGGSGPIPRLDSVTLALDYPWRSGQPYSISMLTSTGSVIEHEIPVAVATPAPNGGVFAAMALLGTYVGIIPVVLGMLFLPVLRRAGQRLMRTLLAVTVGLLAFLAVEAAIEGFELAEGSAAAFGGSLLVVLGAGLAFLALTALDHHLRGRTRGHDADGTGRGMRLAFMISVGIGLHNLGEGLAIGSAYAAGELALGTALVVGFTVQNTTEGLAIVAPLTAARPPILRVVGLGTLAGAPAIVGALIGVSLDNRALAAFMFGLGVGAIVQVMVQISPALRSRPGRVLDPAALGGVAGGLLLMYMTTLIAA